MQPPTARHGTATPPRRDRHPCPPACGRPWPLPWLSCNPPRIDGAASCATCTACTTQQHSQGARASAPGGGAPLHGSKASGRSGAGSVQCYRFAPVLASSISADGPLRPLRRAAPKAACRGAAPCRPSATTTEFCSCLLSAGGREGPKRTRQPRYGERRPAGGPCLRCRGRQALPSAGWWQALVEVVTAVGAASLLQAPACCRLWPLPASPSLRAPRCASACLPAWLVVPHIHLVTAGQS